MKNLANFLFEVGMLKRTPRTGFQFLGSGAESVAEHIFRTAMIGYTLARLDEEADVGKVVQICLFHDIPEARMGDLNSVQKRYLDADEGLAVEHLTRGLPFGADIREMIDEFYAGSTLEARLAGDADQLAFLLDLKSLSDMGYAAPDKWAPHVKNRLRTDAGRKLAERIAETEWDSWWLKLFIDSDTKEK